MSLLDRGSLVADASLTGASWCRAYSDLVDAWFAKLLQDAAGSVAVHGIALVAVGGYGRAELCPHSDIDVMLLHGGTGDVKAIADRLWYPIWDEGLKLGHSVRTAKEALSLAQDDLDTATALLSTRHLAGDPSLTDTTIGSTATTAVSSDTTDTTVDVSTTESTETTETTDTTIGDTTTTEAGDVEGDDDGAHPENHGKDVSEAAHDHSQDDAAGNHGRHVSEVARGDSTTSTTAAPGGASTSTGGRGRGGR